MRLATSTIIMDYIEGKSCQIPAEVSVKACAEAGYKFLDPCLTHFFGEDMPLARDNWETWTHNLRKLSDSLGVSFIQSHGLIATGSILDINGKPRHPKYDEYIRRSIIASEILGVNWMVLHPEMWPDSDGHADYKKSFRYNLDFFAKWGEIATRHNVGIAVENMGNSPGGIMRYCVRAEELIELVDTLNDPMIKICIDTGHAHLSRFSVPDYIRTVGNRLRATHIDDNHQNKDEHFAPFQGTIPWRDVMQALREVECDFDFTFEIQHLTSCFPAAVQAPLVKFSYTLGEYLLSL